MPDYCFTSRRTEPPPLLALVDQVMLVAADCMVDGGCSMMGAVTRDISQRKLSGPCTMHMCTVRFAVQYVTPPVWRIFLFFQLSEGQSASNPPCQSTSKRQNRSIVLEVGSPVLA